MNKFLSLLLILSFLSTEIICAQNKVLIIGIDGCRPDALMAANAPNLKSLMQKGIFTLNAQADELTVSGPSWSSMLTGYTSAKHQVLGNDFENNLLSTYPHFFSYLPKELKLVSIAHWFPINKYIAKPFADKTVFRFDQGVANRCVAYLDGRKSPDVIFLHFDAVDHAGHNTGFSPNNQDYLEAIERIDTYVGEVIAALDNRKKRKPEENWLVLSSTDHGGQGTGHGGGKDDPERRNIFIIAQNDAFVPQQLTGGNVMDVAVTALDFLGTNLTRNKPFDGVSLLP